MTGLIISYARKKYASSYRNSLGIISGLVGILCNVMLCAAKFVLGTLTGSVAITADALNNLSDAASNIVTIVGTKLAAKPVDKEHPFGHGRIEYVSALVVAFLIFLMGIELGKSSFNKILHPTQLKFNFIYVVVIVLAILVKVWMSYFNKKLYDKSGNINLKAVSQDSLNDCISTGATVIAMIVCHVFTVPWFDGVIGLFVSAYIIFSGIGIVRDILNPLLGQPPSQELVKEIEGIILSENLIIGVHDLIVHDYGPGRIIASAHAEVPADVDIMLAHDVIDNIEQRIYNELNIIICLHMDPIVINDDEVEEYRTLCADIIKSYNANYTFHDFRMVKGETHTNLIFDVVIPFEKNCSKQQIMDDLSALFKQQDEKLEIRITVEHSYV